VGRIDPGLQTGLQLGIRLIPVASPQTVVTRDNARLLPIANRHFRPFFALVIRCAVDRTLQHRASPNSERPGPLVPPPEPGHRRGQQDPTRGRGRRRRRSAAIGPRRPPGQPGGRLHHQHVDARTNADRLRECASDNCSTLFVDTSRAAARQWCSKRCADRVNAHRYRRRHRNAT
jgi:hypothetical protein